MIIPSRSKALARIRSTVADIAREVGDNDKLRSQATWLAAALDQLILLEERDSYAELYEQGLELAREATGLMGGTASQWPRDLPLTPADLVTSAHFRMPIKQLLQYHTQSVGTLAKHPNDAIDDYLVRVTDWENSLYQRLRPRPHQEATPGGAVFDAEGLRPYLEERLTHSGKLTVNSVRTLFGGYSKHTTLVAIQDAQGVEQWLVIRAEAPVKLVFLEGADIEKEFACVRYLFESGELPIAEPLWVETDAARFGARFMVSRRASGQILGNPLSSIKTLPEAVRRSIIRTAARIHAQPIDRANRLFKASHLASWTGYSNLEEATHAYVRDWRKEIERAGAATTPILERTNAWLLDNVPRGDVGIGLVHGDYGLANVLIDGEKIGAVLDWELSYLGDPAADFMNLLPEYDKSIFDEYERAGGCHISEYRHTYYLILKIVKGATPIIGMHLLEANPTAPLNFYMLPGYLHILTSPLNALLDRIKRLKNE